MTRASTWQMFGAMVRTEQRIFWRNASTMFFTFVAPLVLLLVITFGSGDRDALAVVVALGILSTAFQGLAMQLSMHRDQGVLKGLLATPLQPLVFVAAKVVSIFVVVAIETVVVLVVGTAFTDAPAPQQPLLLVLFLLLGTFAFAAIGFAVASLVPSAESAPAIVNAAYLALILLTFVFAQVDELPDALARVGDVLPLAHLFGPIHDAWLGEPGSYALGAVVLAAWGVAATWFALRRFRWEPAESIG